jgi:hypothetical protein
MTAGTPVAEGNDAVRSPGYPQHATRGVPVLTLR